MLKSGNKASRATSKPEKHSDHGNYGPGMIQRAAWPQSATPADEAFQRRAAQYVVSLADVGRADVGRVGGKNASLGEMIRSLKEKSVRVPEGFATTADAYREYIKVNGIAPELRAKLEALKQGRASLAATGAAIRQLFLHGEFPETLANPIRAAYRSLSVDLEQDQLAVAVRSSATAEDLPEPASPVSRKRS